MSRELTAEQLAQLREEFEQWAELETEQPWGYLKKKRTASGNYSVQIYSYMWTAYQAAYDALLDELERKDKRIAELEADQTTATGQQIIIEAIGAHGYIVGCLLQGRPDLALEESRKWVEAFGLAALTVEG